MVSAAAIENRADTPSADRPHWTRATRLNHRGSRRRARRARSRRGGPLADDSDLVGEFDRIMRADLGPEAVLERGDDPAAVGVVLGLAEATTRDIEAAGERSHGSGCPAPPMTLSMATWIRSARSEQFVDRDDSLWERGIRPKWMVSGSPRRRPSATFIGSTPPMRSATDVSGCELLGAGRSSGATRPGGRRRLPRARRMVARVMGSPGCSPNSAPPMTGVHSSGGRRGCAGGAGLPDPARREDDVVPAMIARSTWG